MSVFIKKRIAALLLAAMLCSSCSNTGASSSVNTHVSVTQPTTEITSESTETVSETTTEDEEISVSSISVSSVTVSSPHVSSAPDDTDSCVPDETPEITVTEPEEQTTVTSDSTLLSSSETTTTTSAATTTATTTSASESQILADTSVPSADKPPAQIKVLPVSSPGTAVEDTGTARIDYSNASCGYISASYSGKSGSAKLRIISGDVTCDHDLAVTGEAEYFPLMQGSGDYRIQVYEQLDGKKYLAVLDLSVELKVEDEVKMYLYTNRYSVFDEKSACVRKAAELCGGADDDIEKISAIFSYITDNITYDYDLAATVKSGYLPDPDTLLKKKKGICFDYASLFAAMCRSQGIPTRLVIGYAADNIYHAWNEVYTNETGWITPELLLKNKGYNIVDATFYASASDKDYIAGYISDNGNYASVYRY